MLRTTIEHLALRAGLFDAVRSAYHVVGNRPYYHKLKRRQDLFAQFVRPGDLVFDIGANHGEFALVYRRLGARLICLEPNPPLAAKLRARFGPACTVEAAVSESPGRATLYLGSDSNYSTIVDRWLPITRARDRLLDRTVEVTVTTLDHLIATHGLPSFIKIDVEANELSTLRGLHHAVPALMFEYQCPLFDQVAPALDHLLTLGPYVFGLLNQDRITWAPRNALLQQVAGVCGSGAQSGDIYARLA